MNVTLLTAKELANELGVSVKTVRRLHKAGKIPALCISPDKATLKHYRFILGDVIKALKDNTDTTQDKDQC